MRTTVRGSSLSAFSTFAGDVDFAFEPGFSACAACVNT